MVKQVSITVRKTTEGVKVEKTPTSKRKRTSSKEPIPIEEAPKTFEEAMGVYQERKQLEAQEQTKQEQKTQEVKKTTTEKLYSDINQGGGMSVYVPPSKPKEIITPAKTITTFKDKENRIVGVADSLAGMSYAIGQDRYVTQESVDVVEQERATQLQQKAQFQSLDIATQSRLERAKTKQEQEKILKEYTKKQTEIYLQQDYVSINESIQRQREIKKPQYATTSDLYNIGVLNEAQKKASELKSGIFKSPDYREVSDINKLLKKSGYFTAMSRPTSVTTGTEELKLIDISQKGQEITNKLWQYETIEGGKLAAKTYATIIGVPFVAKTLGTVALTSGTGTKIALNVLGKGLQAGYIYNIGRQGVDVVKEVKEGEFYSAAQKGLRFGLDIASYKIITDIIKKPTLQFTGETTTTKVAQGTAFKRQGVILDKSFGGRFTKKVEISGIITKSGQIKYRTTILNYKNKVLDFTEGKINLVGKPTFIKDTQGLTTRYSASYKGYEINKGKLKNIAFETEGGGIINLKQVVKPLDNLQGTKGVEITSSEIKRFEKGFLLNKITRAITVTQAKFVETDIKKISKPRITKTTYYKPSYDLKDVRATRLLKVAATLPAITLMGSKGSLFFSKPTSTFQTPTGQEQILTTGLEGLNIIPSTPTTKPFFIPSFKSEQEFRTDERIKSTNLLKQTQTLQQKQIIRESELIKPSFERTPTTIFKGLEEKQIVTPKEENIITPVFRTDEQTITQQIVTPKEILKPEKVLIQETSPPPPFVPFVFVPPFIPRMEQNTGFKRKQAKTFKKQYQPSLLGIELGERATRTKGLSGFEVRGLPTTKKQRKVKKKAIYGVSKKKPKKKKEESIAVSFFKNAAKMRL